MDRQLVVIVAGGLALFAVAGASVAYALTNGRPSPSQASATASPSAQLSRSPSPASSSPTAAAGYPTALAAGIAGAKAKTGLGYGTCPSSPCLTGSTVVGNTDRASGLNAAYVQLSAGTLVCYSYVYFESAGWHYLNVACPKQSGGNPVLGSADTVRVSGGCANIRANPSLNASVVDCLKDGTSVTIDSTFPRYVDGHIWWSLNNGRGWMAHDFLVTG
jgi:hypothetical protein